MMILFIPKNDVQERQAEDERLPGGPDRPGEGAVARVRPAVPADGGDAGHRELPVRLCAAGGTPLTLQRHCQRGGPPLSTGQPDRYPVYQVEITS